MLPAAPSRHMGPGGSRAHVRDRVPKRGRVLAGAVAATALLAGCSGTGTPPPPPDIGASSSAPAEPSPSSSTESSPSGSTTAPASPGELDDRGNDVVVGTIAARTDEARAVGDAWIAYWRFRQETYADADLDATRLGSVASGAAAEQVVSYSRDLVARDRHVEGDLRVSADRIAVRRDRATLRSCIVNRSTERDDAGEPTEELTPAYVVRGELRLTAGAWRVDDVAIESRLPC